MSVQVYQKSLVPEPAMQILTVPMAYVNDHTSCAGLGAASWVSTPPQDIWNSRPAPPSLAAVPAVDARFTFCRRANMGARFEYGIVSYRGRMGVHIYTGYQWLAQHGCMIKNVAPTLPLHYHQYTWSIRLYRSITTNPRGA